MNNEIEKLQKYVRAANYLTVSQIYLQDNFLLDKKLTFDDIKTRLLGHWGTCPGINFVYACLNNLIIKTKANMIFVLGPGHGFPALQANLFLEGTLSKYYKTFGRDVKGIADISQKFSWPYGYPSHSNPTTPGVILEGGELGYSLSTASGAVLDKPDLIATCLVGDGEAETGPLATSWHLHRLIDPKSNGVVLPILHLNGYKISGPTILARMSNSELKMLFKGYGYEPYIVEGSGNKVYEKMVLTLDNCLADIKAVQKEARERKSEKLESFYKLPMIILRTPKGWTGPKFLKGEKVEGNCLSHQVVGKEMKTDKEELKMLSKWLKSYKFGQLFDKEKGFAQDILDNVPSEGFKMGDNPVTFGIKDGDDSRLLTLPDTSKYIENLSGRGVTKVSSMRKIGQYLRDVFELNKDKKNFRLMSPDETYSNRLQDVFEKTGRAFAGPTEDWDKNIMPDGRVMEMLSEHSLQGMTQGYALTGGFNVFASYEGFMPIVSSMADQFSKFLKIARKTEWRGNIPSINYILTSSGWRQEHNGFSHQNPGFIDTLLQKHNDFVNVYFPADANTALEIMKKCLVSLNEINIIVAEKTIEPVWLNHEEVMTEVKDGISIWKFVSDENPDVVICGCGQYLVEEALGAIKILKEKTPEIKVRFVNILELSPNNIGNSLSQMTEEKFSSYFTEDKPVIFNFHGYPETLKQALFDFQDTEGRFSVEGYSESGSTTTPFDLHLRNKTDRYSIVVKVLEKMADRGVLEDGKASKIISEYNQKIKDHTDYVKEYGDDPEELKKDIVF